MSFAGPTVAVLGKLFQYYDRQPRGPFAGERDIPEGGFDSQ